MNKRITCYWAMLHVVPGRYWLKQAAKHLKGLQRINRKYRKWGYVLSDPHCSITRRVSESRSLIQQKDE